LGLAAGLGLASFSSWAILLLSRCLWPRDSRSPSALSLCFNSAAAFGSRDVGLPVPSSESPDGSVFYLLQNSPRSSTAAARSLDLPTSASAGSIGTSFLLSGVFFDYFSSSAAAFSVVSSSFLSFAICLHLSIFSFLLNRARWSSILKSTMSPLFETISKLLR